MKKNKKLWVIIGLVALVACLSVALVLFVFNSGKPDSTEPSVGTEPVLHTVSVESGNGKGIEKVMVYVYSDSTMAELVWADKTDADGKMTFTDVESDSYVAVLENVPTGYAVEEYYPLTGVETKIVLSAGQMTEEDMQTLTYELGDLVMDFSVTAADGTVYTLFELLEEKDAVVLNFWYINCKPCLMEFPYLQEAYGEYSDKIAVLAMNPMDSAEDVAAFQKENGYTFPMAAVDPSWTNIMKLTAFPTTVVIDRYGNITLIHTGSIDNAQTFKDVFAYFCAEEYEQKLIKDISEIESEKEEGTEENPTELGGVTSFEVTVAPGKVYYTELYKVSNMYLTIYSKDAYVLYNNKTYEPSNGVISVLLTCPDMYTPVTVGIGNNSEEEQTFKVYLVPKLGTFNNPYPLSLGEFTATVSAGNEVGIYYEYKATEDGVLTMQCLSATPGVGYSYYLYNLDSYAMRNLEEDGQTVEGGAKVVSIQVRKGQTVQFSIGTLPDETNSYPSGTFRMLASFDNGAVIEEARPFNEKIEYAVTVKDQYGNGVTGVSVYLSGSVTAQEATETELETLEKVDQYVTTDGTGKATLKHYPGKLEAKIRVPDGYTLEETAYTLTAQEPSVTVTLNKIEYQDYKVTVLAPTGEPVESIIFVVGGKVAYSDANGSAVFSLPVDTYSAMILGVPGAYLLPDGTHQVTQEAPELTVTLGYALGHETNPIVIRDQASIEVEALEGNTGRYYCVYGVGNTTLNLQVTNGYILIDGTRYEPDADGLISAALPDSAEPVSLAVFNTSTVAQNMTVNFAFPAGTQYNPSSFRLGTIGNTVTLEGAGDSHWYYCVNLSTTTSGTLTITVPSSAASSIDVILTNGTQTAKLSESQVSNEVTLAYTGNKNVLIQVVANEDLTSSITFKLTGKISRQAGKAYSVTVVDSDNNPLPGVQLMFMQGGEMVGNVVATDAAGVAEAALTAGRYNVVLVDPSYEYDASAAVVTSTSTSITIVANRTEAAVPEGMTRYNVMVTDFFGSMVGDYLLMFVQNGEVVDYNIVDAAGAVTTKDLLTGTYEVQLAFLGSTAYHYEETTAVVTEAAPSLTVKVAAAPSATPEEHWLLSQITPVSVGGVYVTLQKDVNTYFSFTPTQQGVYRITVSDPDAVLSYWGSPNYPMNVTNELKDYNGSSFTVSVNTNALGQTHVIGIQGTTDSLLSIIREGDAVEDVPYTEYIPAHTPQKLTLASGLKFTFVDIKKSTDTYDLVYNAADGYYHMGSANGPVVYVQLTYMADGTAAPYVTLYDMVGGVGNTGTALRYDDGNGVREDYTTAMLAYGACADSTYGVYPLTQDLIYMIQNGGAYQGWWDTTNKNGNFLFGNGENLEIAWMFALCYIAG